MLPPLVRTNSCGGELIPSMSMRIQADICDAPRSCGSSSDYSDGDRSICTPTDSPILARAGDQGRDQNAPSQLKGLELAVICEEAAPRTLCTTDASSCNR